MIIVHIILGVFLGGLATLGLLYPIILTQLGREMKTPARGWRP